MARAKLFRRIIGGGREENLRTVGYNLLRSFARHSTFRFASPDRSHAIHFTYIVLISRFIFFFFFFLGGMTK